MSVWRVLTAHALRRWRAVHLQCPLLSAAVILCVRAIFEPPVAVAEASAMSVAAVATLWTLYFAADAFAGDAASGRLATESLLPVNATSVWSARASAALASGALQAVCVAALGWGVHAASGDSVQVAQFESSLSQVVAWWPALLVVAAAGLLCSLVAESALAAALLSLALLGLSGFGLASAVTILSSVGLRLSWTSAEMQWGAACVAAAMLVVGAFAFVRGQRKLGSRAVRSFHVAWALAAAAFCGGVATAAEHRARTSIVPEDPRVRFGQATSSSNGRWLALECRLELGGNEDLHSNVWMLDLDSGSRELLCGPAMMVMDRHLHGSLPWNAERPLKLLQPRTAPFGPSSELVVVALDASQARVTTRTQDLAKAESWLQTKLGRDWCELDVVSHGPGRYTTFARWKDRGLELRFEGGAGETWPARAVVPSTTPGRLLAKEGGVLVLHDMLAGSAMPIELGALVCMMEPSPDGAAVLVRTDDDVLRALDTASGAELHEPWPARNAYARWVDSSSGARMLLFTRSRLDPGPDRVVNLDTSSEFAVDLGLPHYLLHHVAGRGLVYVRADGDVVLVDAAGELVNVLIDR